MRDLHHCKGCRRDFIVELPKDVSGDFFLECPSCLWQHYRHFYQGQAIHCDIGKRHEDPKLIKGQQ